MKKKGNKKMPTPRHKLIGGVHGHRAFVFLSPYIRMVDRGALLRLTLNDAIYVCVHCRFSACACACAQRMAAE